MKFRIDHDLHIHSSLSLCSNDPTQTPLAILEYAKKNNFSNIALTDHFWDERIPGASPWYAKQDFAHISEALPLPQAPGVRFLFGAEAEMKRGAQLCITRERIDALDFVIIPTNHLHMAGYTCEESDSTLESRARLLMDRTMALLDMQLPFHKMGIAHFTDSLLAYNSDATHEAVLDSISDGEYFALFTKAAEVGIGIELNVKLKECESESILRPYRIAKKCGAKFYLGSDAHTARGLSEAAERFYAIVEALGLTEEDKIEFLKSSTEP